MTDDEIDDELLALGEPREPEPRRRPRISTFIIGTLAALALVGIGLFLTWPKAPVIVNAPSPPVAAAYGDEVLFGDVSASASEPVVRDGETTIEVTIANGSAADLGAVSFDVSGFEVDPASIPGIPAGGREVVSLSVPIGTEIGLDTIITMPDGASASFK